MRGACAAADPWHGYRQKFRVFFREAKRTSPPATGGLERLVRHRRSNPPLFAWPGAAFPPFGCGALPLSLSVCTPPHLYKIFMLACVILTLS